MKQIKPVAVFKATDTTSKDGRDFAAEARERKVAALCDWAEVNGITQLEIDHLELEEIAEMLEGSGIRPPSQTTVEAWLAAMSPAKPVIRDLEPPAKERAESLRFPRHVAGQIASVMEEVLDDHLFHIAGSWRRGSETVGDLDIMIISKTPLRDLGLPEQMTVGERPDAAVGSEWEHKGITMKIDLWRCPPASEGPFLLFLTGPREMNIAMRAVAKQKRMTLNRYGLFDRDGENRLDDNSESHIFDLLGWNYIDPEMRDYWRKMK